MVACFVLSYTRCHRLHNRDSYDVHNGLEDAVVKHNVNWYYVWATRLVNFP